MAQIRLDAVAMSEAQVTIETIFGTAYKKSLEERKAQVGSVAESKYKEEIFACEVTNEANYNGFLPLVKSVRDNMSEIEVLAKALTARTAEITKAQDIDTNVEKLSTAGVISMR